MRSIKSAFHPWWADRVSAAALAPLTLRFLVSILARRAPGQNGVAVAGIVTVLKIALEPR